MINGARMMPYLYLRTLLPGNLHLPRNFFVGLLFK